MKSGDLFKLALLAGGGYLLYTYLVQSGLWAQWFGGASPLIGSAGAATGNAGLPTTAVNPTGQYGVTLQDNSGGSVYKVGDNFTLTVIGPPNAPVTVTAVHNGQSIGTGQLGSTDPSGRFTISNTWAAQHAGTWAEQISVGGAPVGSISFTVQAVAGIAGFGAIVPVPNNGPALAPIPPSMSFGNRGWGGGNRGKRNGYIQ